MPALVRRTILAVCAYTAFAVHAEPVKVAVMDLKARSGIDNMTVSSLTDFVCTTILDVGEYDVIGKDDMKTMMEHIADRQLLDCDDTRCLAKIGGALGVQLLVSGNIGMVGKMYLINIKLIDIDEATVRNRVSEKYLGDETGLVSKVEASIHKLFGDADPEPDPDPEPEPEPEPEVVQPVAQTPAPAPAAPAPARVKPADDDTQGVRFRLMLGSIMGQAMENPDFYDYIYDEYSLDPHAGIYFGAAVRVPVAGKLGLLFEPSFSQKNFYETATETAPMEYSTALDATYDTWYYHDYIDLLGAVDYQAGSIHMTAGLSLGILLDAYSTQQVTLTEVDGWGNTFKNQLSEEDFDENDFRSGGSLALVLGGGYAGRHLLADLRLSIGLTNIIEFDTTYWPPDIPEPYWSLLLVQFLLGYQF